MPIDNKTVIREKAALSKAVKEWISQPYMSYGFEGHTRDPVFPQDRQDMCVIIKELLLDGGKERHQKLYLVWWDKKGHMKCHDFGLGLLGEPLTMRVTQTKDEIQVELEGPSGYSSRSFSKKEIDLAF